ncbi:hypothetical protein AOL_s00097g62 [Orbilia oligospora ATCC 24927]|uniref:Methyltransferase domain-containing protein n=1 Tax=Arthrobotrys oligospora (strain ATCC 24927 / CBS 115.81 / DSM 1491) TaxID=756982 RepID=G1XI85_ARTOA|nr:hypothetical protein AOL_s00097g62 [Orbilia oligospora ATCC 24927]EGX47016.1 hypothetical protein AOL_s00097g62 [Orbilia oligospora ATCC 24927]
MSEPGRLLNHFQDRLRKDQSDGWSSLWETDESDLWDRGKPSPALIDFVECYGRNIFHDMKKDDRCCRLKALVPIKGCGRGYEVIMLALHGFDAYGLEVSSKVVDIAKEYAESQLESPDPSFYGEKRSEYVRGSANFVLGDFFQKNWETNCGIKDDDKFDLIYDYTFLCALLPEMRFDWARRMQDLLKPGGVLVCLEFPLWKDHQSAGPPWGLDGVYWNLLAEGKDGILTSTPALATRDGTDLKGPFTRLVHYKPDRSYDQGRGTDMMSIWRPAS